MMRTRFAPSPTGSIHVGNTRSAIWNYLFTRHNKGFFILRIEDTDLARSKREDEIELRKNLDWLGLEFDDGVTNPYRQSERLDIYKKYAYQLLEEGKAFKCFCTDEELVAKREKAKKEKTPQIYDGRCKRLTTEQIKEKEAQGIPWAIRLKIDYEDVAFDDMIKGHVVMKKGMFGDFVILRSNGVAVYNFCVVVDDILMGITHILRAQEHLTNAAKQILVYRALNATIPKMGHTPLLLAPDGSKLSKRYGATSLQEYRELGYLREAIINYLAILGWTPPDGREKLSKQELIELFDVNRISKSSSKFDIQKFRWLNSLYIKDLEPNERDGMLMPYLEKAYDLSLYTKEQLKEILNLVSGGLEYLAQIVELVKPFFTMVVDKNSSWNKEPYKDILIKLKDALLKLDDNPSHAQLEEIVKQIGKELGLKGKELFMPIRVFTTGQEHGPALYETLTLIGKKSLLQRLEQWLS
jgi:nondiscriminating glutamyl-tRNA synthetase